MKDFPGLKILFFLLLSLAFGACAVDRPPSGGPPDTTPLTVTTSSPVPGAINISPKVIRLAFNRYVSREELAKAIHITPMIRNYELSVHGRQAEILLYEPLKPGRTYTLTLQGSLRGFFGNPLASTWTLAFSTGPTINTGTIEGRVWSHELAPSPNATILAWALDPAEAALSDSTSLAPDYIIQTDASGFFRFESLSEGRYRIIAINDTNNNRRYDQGRETYGVTSAHWIVTGTSGVSIRMAPPLSGAPEIISARALNNQETELTFNGRFTLPELDPAAFTVTDKRKGEQLQVLGLFTGTRSGKENIWRLITNPMRSGSTYLVTFAPAGATEPSETTFTGSGRKIDYPALTVSLLPTDGSTEVLPETIHPEAGPAAEIRFNLPVAKPETGTGVALYYPTSGGRVPAPFSLSAVDNRTWQVKPAGVFEPGKEYEMAVRPSLLQPLIGGAGKDTLALSRFRTAPPNQYGSIAVTGKAPASAVIELQRTGSTFVTHAEVRPSTGGGFSHTFNNLPPGDYTIAGFVQATGTRSDAGIWQAGSVEPFVPADPFTAITVTVRPGWKTESPVLDIPARPSDRAAETAVPRVKQNKIKRRQ